MNEVIKLLEILGMPAILITTFTLLMKLKPITFLTSNQLERKISTKEWSFSHNLTLSIIKTTGYSFFILASSMFSFKWDWLNNRLFETLTYIIGLILILAFYKLIYIEDKRKRYEPDINWKKNLISLIIVALYFFGWLVFFTLIIGRKAFLIYYKTGSPLSLNHIISIYLVIFISSFLLLLVYKPLSYYLAFNKEKQFKMTIEGKEWYLLNPISKEEFMLGNQPNYNDSTQLKIIKREALLENQFEVVDTL
jgi:hypothetical protein